MLKVVDPHIHLWDLWTRIYPHFEKPGKGGANAAISRSYLLEEYLEEGGDEIEIVGAVHVEAFPTDPVKESETLQAVADRSPVPIVLVANGDLAAPDFPALLDRHAAFPIFRGIRQVVNRHADSKLNYITRDLMDEPAWIGGLKELGRRGLSFDLQLYPHQIAQAAKLAADIGAIKDGWNGFGVLQPTASVVGALDIGFVPGEGGLSATQMAATGALDVLFSLGADEIDVAGGAFVVYNGTHGDRGAHRADVILPGAAYTEKSSLYVNTEGRVQMANRASFPPGEAREDWAILRALSDVLGKKLPFDSLTALRQAIFKAVPHLMRIDQIAAADASAVRTLAGRGGVADKAPIKATVANYYLTNPIARASAVMAECARLASGQILTAAE